MQIKQNGKLTLLAALISLMTLLSACSSHPNPLTTAEPQAAAEFLVTASQAAEKKLNVFQAPGGYFYGACMRGKEKQSVCQQLYQAMVHFAKTTKRFQMVTVRDLTDQRAFQKLKTDYDREQFNAV